MSFPQAFIDSLKEVPGLEEPEELLASLEDIAPTSIRLNPSKYSQVSMHLSAAEWSNHGYYLSERPSFVADPLFHAGVYYVQEASSMVIGKVIQALLDRHFQDTNVRVLDLCAAPGGKSTDIIANLRERDLLLSNEVVKSRAQILKENVIKWGYPNHLVSNNDPRDFERLPGYFDVIAVDAPCSGEGMFRKDLAAREEWSPEHVKLCSARQERIVSDVWQSLSEDGFLIYSTCTFNRDENESILDFLTKEFDAELINVDIGVSESDSLIQRFFPNKLKGEGFSYLIVRKHSSERSLKLPKIKTKRVEGLPIQVNIEGRIVQEGDDFLFYTHDQDSELLSRNLRLIRNGLSLGSMKKNKWVPDPETAFSISIENDLPKLELDVEQAQAFLKCETFDLLSEARGYHQVSFEGYGLGYINHLGNRFNNYYPSHWRIRTQQPLKRTSILS